MAFKSDAKPERIEIPHEPGQWIELIPPSGGDLRDLSGLESYEYSFGLAARMITRWSYERDITIENIADLDAHTIGWLAPVLREHMNVRDDEEKKESSSDSTPGRARAAVTSLAS